MLLIALRSFARPERVAFGVGTCLHVMEDSFAQLGFRNGWGQEVPFGLSRADRRYHAYVLGQSGSGKSTLLKNLIIQDIEAGHGVSLIDPHGDLAAELLDYIPPWRSDHAVYFDPADSEFPIGINLLADVPPSRRHLAIAGIVSSFKNIWRDSWGPRLEHILSNSLAAITESQNVSLLACHRILVDDHYRARIVKQVRDPMVRQFWLGEFERYDARFRAEVTAPVLNKLGALLLSPALRNVLGQVRNKIDFRFMIDDRRIFIANLAKGRIGDAASNLLGSLLISAFQLAAMSRAEIAEADRVDHCLVVDEFQNFATDSFASILSESRKYHLGISLAHQYMQQLPDEIAAAVFGNVGSWISFRVGERDANVLSREFGPPYPAATFSSLRNFEVIARVLQRGSRSDPFIGRTLPPTARRHGRRKNLIQRSRERYATRRDVVEDRINRWMQR